MNLFEAWIVKMWFTSWLWTEDSSFCPWSSLMWPADQRWWSRMSAGHRTLSLLDCRGIAPFSHRRTLQAWTSSERWFVCPCEGFSHRLVKRYLLIYTGRRARPPRRSALRGSESLSLRWCPPLESWGRALDCSRCSCWILVSRMKCHWSSPHTSCKLGP